MVMKDEGGCWGLGNSKAQKCFYALLNNPKHLFEVHQTQQNLFFHKHYKVLHNVGHRALQSEAKSTREGTEEQSATGSHNTAHKCSYCTNILHQHQHRHDTVHYIPQHACGD
ncbi:hypothetical protein XENORESO_020110 [Xenotaenia resolanae]|uniref:Uncharacterized protein n=1 Tax=Xenotaenia resolanae TaxID=208358 RepID=A0ABV0WD10_9TELE